MPVKSSFFPKEALQGEDLPSHITWSDLKFDLITVVFSGALTLKEIYNVARKDIVRKEGLITIQKTEVDGYLGLVFSTKILEQKAVDEKIEYTFVYRGKTVESIAFDVHLFRPDVVIGDVPSQISVDVESGDVFHAIAVKNLGEGTAIIDIRTTPESELQKHASSFAKQFIKDLAERIKLSIGQLKTNFSENALLLDRIGGLMAKNFEFDREAIEELKEIDEDFSVASNKDPEFGKAVGETFSDAILRAAETSNIFQFLLDYINSIGKEKIIIRDPLSVVDVSQKPVTLRAEIRCIDLLTQTCEPIVLPPVSVVSRQPGEISLFKLFKWGGE